MSSGSASAVPMQGIIPTPTSSQTVPGSGLGKVPYPGEDKQEKEWEPEFRETFSKGILKMRIQEFQGGKYTKRYIEAYLEFMVLSGMINNLDYLDFKNTLAQEEV